MLWNSFQLKLALSPLGDDSLEGGELFYALESSSSQSYLLHHSTFLPYFFFQIQICVPSWTVATVIFVKLSIYMQNLALSPGNSSITFILSLLFVLEGGIWKLGEEGSCFQTMLVWGPS